MPALKRSFPESLNTSLACSLQNRTHPPITWCHFQDTGHIAIPSHWWPWGKYSPQDMEISTPVVLGLLAPALCHSSPKILTEEVFPGTTPGALGGLDRGSYTKGSAGRTGYHMPGTSSSHMNSSPLPYYPEHLFSNPQGRFMLESQGTLWELTHGPAPYPSHSVGTQPLKLPTWLTIKTLKMGATILAMLEDPHPNQENKDV